MRSWFQKHAEGYQLAPTEKLECLELSDDFMFAYMGVDRTAGGDVSDLVDLYVFHASPLWSMRLVLRDECRVYLCAGGESFHLPSIHPFTHSLTHSLTTTHSPNKLQKWPLQ